MTPQAARSSEWAGWVRSRRTVVMEPTYVSIAPLVQSTEQKGAVLDVVFQDAQGGPPVSASAALRRSTGVAGATRATVQRKMLSRLSFAISRAVNQAVGDVPMLGTGAAQQARSVFQGLADKVNTNFSAEEQQAAVVEAFESVREQFRWDGAAWAYDAAGARSEFQQRLDDAPITERADLDVLARMLVELASADGDFGDEEREFLGTFLPGDLDLDGIIDGPALSDADLRGVSEGDVRETMLMLAWGLAFCDDELAAEEQALCRTYARGLVIAPSRRKAIRKAAEEFVRGS